jgi:putative transposase
LDLLINLASIYAVATLKSHSPTESADALEQPLSDNGSAYTAEQKRLFARQIGLQPVTTPVHSPQSNGMAESFVKTIKRDYVAQVPMPDRETALRNLEIAFEHSNEQHSRNALNYRSPREFRRLAAASI